MNPASETAAGQRPHFLSRVVREPLLHFMLIGVVIFLVGGAVKNAKPVVSIDSRELKQLSEYWEMQMQRPPNKQEMAGLVRDRIDEEILAREARRLGLDRDDMIVRRRLAQKMAFANEDTERPKEPDEAALKAFYQVHKSDYQAPGRIALRHLYFSDDRAGLEPKSAAITALAGMKTEETPVSDPFVLPLAYADVSPQDLARDYGPAFAKAVQAAPIGAWVGPVRSEYGWHIVKVEARRTAQDQAFEAVRVDVRDALLAEQRKARNAAWIEGLRRRYRVEVAGARPNGELRE